MTLKYNPASLRVKEVDGTPDVSGVVTLVLPDGTVTDLGRGAVQISVATGTGSASIGIPGVDGEDGYDSLIPGPAGSAGPMGPMGATGFQGLDGEIHEETLMLALPQQVFGVQAPTPNDVQIFTTSGTWFKPAGAVVVSVVAVGGGGSGPSGGGAVGGGGAQDSASSGGGGGAVVEQFFLASELPSSVTVTVGAGVAGGASVSGTSGLLAGNNGTAGNLSSFGTFVFAYGGGRGIQSQGSGVNVSGGGGGGGGGVGATGVTTVSSLGGLPAATAGTAGISTQGGGSVSGSDGKPAEYGGGGGGGGDLNNGRKGGDSLFGAGAGGGGGGVNASGAVFAAVSGGNGGGRGTYSSGSGPAGGTGQSINTASGTATGNPGADGTRVGLAGEGGGGGGNAINIHPTSPVAIAGKGGNGGVPGGGGGAGGNTYVGASPGFGSQTTGAGGDGARGEVIVTCWSLSSAAMGAQGLPGPIGPPGLEPEEPEVPLGLPGPVGPQGVPGTISSQDLADITWNKKFFSDNSLLPATNFKDSTSSWPAFDSTATSTGHVWSTDIAWERDTSTSAASNSGAAGWWDIGATKSIILIVVGGMGQGGTTTGQVALFAGSGVPIATASKSAYEFIFLNNNGGFALYKTDSSGTYTQVSVYGAAGTMAAQTRADSYPIGAALRIDGGAHTVMGFLRFNSGQWIRVLNSSDSTLTSFRYVGVRTTQTSTTTPMHFWFVSPVEVWYTA